MKRNAASAVLSTSPSPRVEGRGRRHPLGPGGERTGHPLPHAGRPA